MNAGRKKFDWRLGADSLIRALAWTNLSPYLLKFQESTDLAMLIPIFFHPLLSGLMWNIVA